MNNNIRYYEISIDGVSEGDVSVATFKDWRDHCEHYGYEHKTENGKEIITNGKHTYEYTAVKG